MSTPTTVVGGGVVGLACATRLLEAGHDVVVVARDALEDSTSAVAAAVWYPYLAEPRELVLGWATRTLEVLRGLAGDPDAFVRERELLELFPRAAEEPWWGSAVGGVGRAGPEDLVDGFTDGLCVRVPVVESLPHLRWLEARLVAAGGRIERRALTREDLDALREEGRLVVNCTGLGAAAVCADDAVTPVRGQVVRVANPGVERCVVADEGPLGIAYVIPRSEDVILGGTADEGATDRTPDPEVTARILRAAAALEPKLADPEVLDVRVGLRPYRSSVRVERDDRGVVHCYGHGGSGFTLSWGCAEDVVRLATEPA
jgi:D-amino-acid oxidase